MSVANRSLDPAIFAESDESLNEREDAFVEHYLALGGQQGKAAELAGYPASSAASTASRLVRKPKIQKQIMKRTLESIGLAAVPALRNIERLSRSSKSDYVRLEASKDLLDRAGFKPPERVQYQLDASLRVQLNLGSTPAETPSTIEHDNA